MYFIEGLLSQVCGLPLAFSLQVMAIVGGVNPLEDLMDVYIWQ